MPQITAEEVTRAVQDAFYVGVGLGVIGFQKAQVRRVELTKAVKGRVGSLTGSVDDRVKLVEERLGALEERIESVLDEVEAKLPDPARDVVGQARGAAREVRQQVRSAVGRAA